MLQTITTRSTEIIFDSEKQLLTFILLNGVEIDVPEVRENIEATKKLTQGTRYLTLVDARSEVSITKEAQKLGTKPEYSVNQIAQAIIATSVANRLIGNFLINFYKPASPTKLFTNAKEALEWLNNCLKKEKRREEKKNRKAKNSQVNLLA